MTNNYYLEHHGIRGMKWGERRFQYDDGSLTPAGRDRYGVGEARKKTPFARIILSKKKNVVDTDKDNTANQQNKPAKTHGPRHFGILGKKTVEPLTEEEKNSLILSGNTDKIIARASELSPAEMASALQRARDIEALKQYSDKEGQRKETLAQKALDKIKNRDEDEKLRILRSGDTEKILKNQSKFSTQELNDAVNRTKTRLALEEQAKVEKRANSLLGKALNLTTRTLDVLDKANSIKKKWEGLFEEDYDSEFANLSPQDALLKMSSWSTKKLNAYKDRVATEQTAATSLSNIIKAINPKKDYDFSNLTGKQLQERYMKSTDKDEKAAIAQELATLATNAKNANNADNIGNPTGNERKKGGGDQNGGGNNNNNKQNNQQKKDSVDPTEAAEKAYKEKLLKSGNLKDILNNADKFSTKEIEDAMARNEKLKSLSSTVKAESDARTAEAARIKAEAEAKQKADPKYRAQEEARQQAKIDAMFDAQVNAATKKLEDSLRPALDKAYQYKQEDRAAQQAYSKIEDSWAQVRSKEALKNSDSKAAKKEYQETMSNFADTLADVANDIKEENRYKADMTAYYRQQTEKLLFGDLGDQPITWDYEDHNF